MERPNIVLKGTCRAEEYRGRGRPVRREVRQRDRELHAERIQSELIALYAEEDELRRRGIVTRDGSYLEFEGPKGGDLTTASLENRQSNVHLLNVRNDGDATRATVFVPGRQRDFFPNRVRQYATENTKGEHPRPKHERLVSSIEGVKYAANALSFWTDAPSKIPWDSRCWVEIWIRTTFAREDENEQAFISLLERVGIRFSEGKLRFPERSVFQVLANYDDLNVLVNQSELIAEMRPSISPTSFYEDLDPRGQREWIDDLLERTTFEPGPSVVCILDSGVNTEHPLIKPFVSPNGVHTVNDSWGLADVIDHGTRVAGIALYDDLKEKLDSSGEAIVTHRLESVKIFDSRHPVDDQELIGDIVQQAMARAEAYNDEPNRVFCSAVTANEDEITDGTPNSWSAAVDDVVAHAYDPSDDSRELFLVSAGNVTLDMLNAEGFPDANYSRTVRTPGQAWNALTVGAYSDSDKQTEQSLADLGYEPVADCGDMSPYTTTSRNWLRVGMPVKPEIVCAGGNVISNGVDHSNCSDLSRLTTGADLLLHPLVQFNATSAAVAQAAWMAAELENAYPELWPETIRGLMVHSARWTDQMKSRFVSTSDQDRRKKGRRDMLRSCGYGVPSLERAMECKENSVNLIIQESIQPFQMIRSDKGSRDASKDMHLHVLPWPAELLRELGNAGATLRVTLSYYIEPGPGRIGWKDKYRYASHGLRFDVNKPDEDIDSFERRLNAYAQGADEEVQGGTSKGWYLGPTNRDVGSIHSDYKETTAIELSEVRYVAVYPVVGWWRKRGHLGMVESKTRYSLIVSIETPEVDADLYAAIRNKVEIKSRGMISVF